MAGILKKLLGTKPSLIEDPMPEERQPENKPKMPKGEPWIGVDLDGTLAKDGAWTSVDSVGPPVPVMMERVKFWLSRGLTVKIMTARASLPDGIPPVKKWLAEQGLPDLEVTNAKDFDMVELWDDRAIQIVQNTGRPFLSPSIVGRPRAPILPNEVANETFYTLPFSMTKSGLKK